MSKFSTTNLVAQIKMHHALLVYPLANKSEPLSLWSALFPKQKMVWEWDADGDDRVAEMWHMRERMSQCGKVVYSKWYQGRATFFSREAFGLLQASFRCPELENRFLLGDAKRIYQSLDEHSPRSTKAIKKDCDLSGKLMEPAYQRATKELFERGLIVGWGEKDEGAFPSLQLGAARHFFEDEWRQAAKLDADKAQRELAKLWGEKSKFYQFFLKLRKKYAPLSGL